jgi:hypothetical protein
VPKRGKFVGFLRPFWPQSVVDGNIPGGTVHKTLKRHRKIVLGLVVAVVSIACWLSLVPREPAPVYLGKTIGEWYEEFPNGTFNFPATRRNMNHL